MDDYTEEELIKYYLWFAKEDLPAVIEDLGGLEGIFRALGKSYLSARIENDISSVSGKNSLDDYLEMERQYPGFWD